MPQPINNGHLRETVSSLDSKYLDILKGRQRTLGSPNLVLAVQNQAQGVVHARKRLDEARLTVLVWKILRTHCFDQKTLSSSNNARAYY